MNARGRWPHRFLLIFRNRLMDKNANFKCSDWLLRKAKEIYFTGWCADRQHKCWIPVPHSCSPPQPGGGSPCLRMASWPPTPVPLQVYRSTKSIPLLYSPSVLKPISWQRFFTCWHCLPPEEGESKELFKVENPHIREHA